MALKIKTTNNPAKNGQSKKNNTKTRTCTLPDCDNELTKNQKKYCSREHFHTHKKQKSNNNDSKEVTTSESEASAEPERRKLNPRQEKFCQLYAKHKEFMGNGVQSYIEAYDVSVGRGEGQMTYQTCRSSASQLLTNMNVTARIDELLAENGLNDQHVDKQLLFLVNQFDEKRTKLEAIKEYNRMKGRAKDGPEQVNNYVLGVFQTVHEQADDIEQGEVIDPDNHAEDK